MEGFPIDSFVFLTHDFMAVCLMLTNRGFKGRLRKIGFETDDPIQTQRKIPNFTWDSE